MPCCACGSQPLRAHLRVGGQPGPEGLAPTTTRYGTALADIVRCERCGHGQVQPMPATESLDAGYGAAASGDYLAEETGQRASARSALAAIERHAAPGRLLDLGCWLGFLLAEAEPRGWRGTGIEPSRFASSFARKRLGLDVRTADLMTAELELHAFGAIVMNDVLEHLSDPFAALERCRALLTPAGVLYMALPDAGSALARLLGARWWSVIPTHVQYFTRRSLTTLLHRGGWEVLDLRTAPKVFTINYYLSRLEGYSPTLARGSVKAAQVMGLGGRLVKPDFRDRVAVIARPLSTS